MTVTTYLPADTKVSISKYYHLLTVGALFQPFVYFFSFLSKTKQQNNLLNVLNPDLSIKNELYSVGTTSLIFWCDKGMREVEDSKSVRASEQDCIHFLGLCVFFFLLEITFVQFLCYSVSSLRTFCFLLTFFFLFFFFFF